MASLCSAVSEREKNMISGVMTALVTPFRTDRSIDVDALDRLVDMQIENGVDALGAHGNHRGKPHGQP